MTGQEFLGSLLTKHFITIVLIIVYGLKLVGNKKTRDAELRYSWITLISCSLLVLEDMAESVAAADPDLLFFRILFSVTGYALRPVAAVGLLLVICPQERRSWKIWILCVINLAVHLTAFFSPIAFSFDQDYGFVRGPLGYSVFIIALVYMVLTLVLIWQRYYEGRKTEKWILIICAASCMASALVDMAYGGCRVNEAIMISSIFFYMFLRSHDNRLDPLTALDNRFAFYDDIQYRKKSVSAIASLDLNGLKAINDMEGHAAGDTAIAEIGRCLRRLNSNNTMAYRTGGDEFVVLFMQQGEETVGEKLKELKACVTGCGYSISVGYAMLKDGGSIEEGLRESDKRMYEEKAEYYRQKGMDRRKHR